MESYIKHIEQNAVSTKSHILYFFKTRTNILCCYLDKFELNVSEHKHFHPSSDLTPSEADLAFTHRMVEAGDVLGIELLDHFIVSGEKWLSFKEIGFI